MNPFDGPQPKTLYDELQGARNARRASMEADLAHCRAMATATSHDPAAAREHALWLQIAGEFEAFLRPEVAAVAAPLFGGLDPPS